MTTIISGIVCLIAGIICVLSITVGSGPQVGDVFVHANPGTGSDPDEPADPFAQIYRIEEIREGKALVKIHSVHLDGRVVHAEYWRNLSSVSYDEKVGHEKEKP